MKNLLFPIFLSMAVICHAQEFPKNELSVGISAGGFFDSTAFKVASLRRYTHNFVLTYTRNHSSHFSTSVAFARYFFPYIRFFPERLRDNTIIQRSVRRLSLSGIYTLPAGWFYFRMKGGLNYCWGYKLDHYYYFGSGIWQEPVREGVGYNKWGVTTGLSINHKIVWGIFGSIQADYVRMFKGIDPNQLYLSYSLGYRF
jgi:hypothetical protein